MADDTLNEKTSSEKAIHERIAKIDVRIINLKNSLQELCKLMLKNEVDKSLLLTIEEMIRQLSASQLQLHYYDGIIHDKAMQQQNEPLIIKETK